MNLADLHVHPSLPWVGSAWRRRIQGFRPAAWEGAEGADAVEEAHAAMRENAGAFRLYGAVFYQTCLLRPRAARERLFRSLAAFTGRRLLSVSDLAPLLAAHTAAIGKPEAETAAAGNDPALAGSGAKWPLRTGISRELFFLAVESMRYLRDPGDVARLWEGGVRSLQPIHFLDTPWGGSSREGMLPDSRTGLTGLGREMLAEMSRLGMILDLAHMSRRNAEDCLGAYKGPVMCSHAGFQGIRKGARNLDADLAREIFRRRGLVGVTCWRHLLGPDPLAAPAPALAKDRESLPADRGSRAAWTRSYCATAAAFAALAPDAGVAVGSDRGAPIRAPAWFYSPAHLAEMSACLSGHGWDAGKIRGFLSGHALDFLSRSLPA